MRSENHPMGRVNSLRHRHQAEAIAAQIAPQSPSDDSTTIINAIPGVTGRVVPRTAFSHPDVSSRTPCRPAGEVPSKAVLLFTFVSTQDYRMVLVLLSL